MTTETAPSPAGRPGKGVRTTATVTAVRRLTPHMVRVTLGGEALTELAAGPFPDRYIKLVLGELEDGRPLLRTYTVRAVREGAWDIDVVLHGAENDGGDGGEGFGGPWAAASRPGDEVTFAGPGGEYTPDADADWHLLVGDESALPAIAAALEALPAGAVAHAFVEVDGPQEHQEITSAADVRLVWADRSAGADVAEVVRAAHAMGTLPDGVPHAFLHGEAGCVRELRRWVRAELNVPRELLSASGYWRRGRTDEGWRAEKPDWKAAVEHDDEALAAAH